MDSTAQKPATEDRFSKWQRPERRGVSRSSVIESAKAKVSTLDLARHQCGGKLRRVGEHYTACCPLPDHDDKTPSFCVYPETNSWWCFGCLRGGDVLELARFRGGYEKSDVATCAGFLLLEFGHELPKRPDSWFHKNSRQEYVRRELEAEKIRRIQRRIYRWLLAPEIAKLEDEDERAEESRISWQFAGELARALYLQIEQQKGRDAA